MVSQRMMGLTNTAYEILNNIRAYLIKQHKKDISFSEVVEYLNQNFPPHLCKTCIKCFAECKSNPKFLIDHPYLKPRDEYEHDLVYECDTYQKKQEAK